MENINKNNIPKHIAIIMDGNDRWAKSKGKSRIYGHKNAKNAIKDSIEICVELKVQYLTLFTFSTENWNRPNYETKALIQLIESVMKSELNNLHKNNIILNIIGDLSRFSIKTKNIFQNSINKTKNNSGLSLILAINYSGKWDIINSISKIKENYFSPQKIINLFEKNLSTYKIPNPELIIRTGGELRISNFYLWQMAYSEFIFLNIFWPDFRKKDIINGIFEFQNRKRRFGGL